MRWDTDVLAIRSLDKASWYDLEVSIFGFVTTATEGKQPTGRYQMKRPLVLAGEMTAFNLGDFQKPTGEQWISLTMVVDSVDLKALLRGEPCATEVSASTSVSEIINAR
jgi:hypothetical protein